MNRMAPIILVLFMITVVIGHEQNYQEIYDCFNEVLSDQQKCERELYECLTLKQCSDQVDVIYGQCDLIPSQQIYDNYCMKTGYTYLKHAMAKQLMDCIDLYCDIMEEHDHLKMETCKSNNHNKQEPMTPEEQQNNQVINQFMDGEREKQNQAYHLQLRVELAQNLLYCLTVSLEQQCQEISDMCGPKCLQSLDSWQQCPGTNGICELTNFQAQLHTITDPIGFSLAECLLEKCEDQFFV